MIKKDWCALFSPGICGMTLSELERICLDGELATTRRIELFARLSLFLTRLAATGCRAEVWIDGSFTTRNPDPSDIDIAVFLHDEDLAGLDHEDELAIEALLDHEDAAIRFGLDLHLAIFGDFDRTAYWRGVFGFCHDEVTPKGIAALQLGTP